jgi:hypothetical protein
MIEMQLARIVDNASQMFTVLNVALAAITIMTKMWYFFDSDFLVIFLPLFVILLVIKVIIFLDYVGVFLGKLVHHIDFLSHVGVVWINEHEFIVVCNVEVLICLEVFLEDVQFHFLFLDKELLILMIVERFEVIVSVITIVPRIFQFLDIAQLELIIAQICLSNRVITKVFRARENVRIE